MSLTGLTAVPASALILPTEPPTSVNGEPHTFRNSDENVADIPAKPKKAKKNTKTLVIMAYSKKKDATTPALLKSVYFDQVDRWMRWESAGRQGEKGKVTKWLKISKKTHCADQDTLTRRAVKAASKAGYKPSKYQRIAIYFPKCSAIAWSGLGSIGKDRDKKYHVWLNGAPTLQVIAHESLHNYGLLHSASTKCGAVSWPKSTRGCTVTQYGDPFDVMGNTDIAMSASAKYEVGWLTKKQYKTIKKGAKTFVITANESANKGTKLVRISMGKKRFLEVEYRSTGALDHGLDDPTIPRPSQSGVQVRSVKPHDDYDDYGRTIVDVLPNNSESFASIPAGQSWTAYNNMRISVISTDGANAVVVVQFKAPAATVPAVPSTPDLVAAPPTTAGWAASAVAGVLPISGNGMPVLSYDFELTNQAGVVAPFSIDALGGSILTSNIGNLPYGTFQVRVSARNELGPSGWSAWSAPLVLPEPLPVIGATSVDSGTVPATFTWRQFSAVITPNVSTGAPITKVYLSNTKPAGNNGGCYAVLKAGTTDTWVCPEAYYSDYPLFTGANTLVVQAQDAQGHYATKTVNFTVTP